MSDISDDWLTVEQAAELSGYHPVYLRGVIRSGQIQAKKISFMWFINRQSLIEYISQAEQSGDKRRGPKS